MRYQTFGRLTGLRVSEYALGTANFSTSSTGAGVEGSRQIFEAFVAAGGTTFDTANFYRDGESETVLGGLLGRRRDDFVVVTKYSGATPPARLGTTGNSRKIMVRSLEASLRRLNTDYVDIFMPHFPDGLTPIEEILAGLDDLSRSGKILHGGLSNFPAWRIASSVARADLRNLSPLVGIETEYNLAERSAERELLPVAEAHGLGVVLYSPLAKGLLTGKYRRGEEGQLSPLGDAIESSAQSTAIVDAVLAIADEVGVSAVQVSLAWLRRQAALSTTAVIPIVGPRTLDQLEEYLKSLHLELSDEHYQRLDQVSAIKLGTPHEANAFALQYGYDGDRSLLEPLAVPVI